MTPGPTLGDAFAWAFWFLGEVTFKWVPSVVVTVVGTAPPLPPGTPMAPQISMIPNPVTAPEIVDYLQLASAPGVYANVFHKWSVFVALSLFISLMLGALIIYCSIRIFQIRQIERRKLAAYQHTVAAQDVPKTQLRWRRVTEQIAADDEQKWRLAILEADIMLNELLDTLGYKGETMADKMKSVDPAAFNTIDLAWEAHKLRNKIVHEGLAHHLDPREVHRIIGLYEKVFREFRFIE